MKLQNIAGQAHNGVRCVDYSFFVHAMHTQWYSSLKKWLCLFKERL